MKLVTPPAVARAGFERSAASYWKSPWPAEDGGPRRSQAPVGLAGVARAAAGRAPIVTHRDAFGATMLVLREPGEELARAAIPTMFQSVVFPAPGWSNDLYYCSFSTIARVVF